MVDDNDNALSALLKDKGMRYAAPPELRRAIGAAIRAETPEARPWWPLPAWLRLTSALACGLLLGVLTANLFFLPGERAAESNAVLAAHVRSLQVAHLEDIASTNKHSVKPWFAGKLDFSPPVGDFSSQGFPLTGGRLDYVDKHVAAALVCRRHGHAINVFVWPTRDGEAPEQRTTRRDGFNLIAWNADGMQFWVISDINADELTQFSALVKSGDDPK